MSILAPSTLLVALLLFATSAAAAPTLSATLRTEHFVVHYDPSDPFLAKLMARAAHDQLIRISRDLGQPVYKGRPFPLYVYPTHYGFLKAGGLETRKFTVGTARSTDERISVDASGAFALPEDVLAHEITHAIIFRALGPRASQLPLWANEGLAQFHSEGLTADDRGILAEAAATGTVIPLPRLASRFPDERMALAYAQSASAIDYMVRKHGRDAPRVILQELSQGASVDQAFHTALGMTHQQFARDWYAHITHRFWGLRVSRVATAVVSALMAVLVIAAFLARRRQKVEAARRWDEEELDQAIRRQQGNDWSRM